MPKKFASADSDRVCMKSSYSAVIESIARIPLFPSNKPYARGDESWS